MHNSTLTALGKTTKKLPRWLFLFSDNFLRFSPFEKADICVKKSWLLQKLFVYRNTSRKRASNSTSQRKVSAEDFHSTFFIIFSDFGLWIFFGFLVFSVVDSFLSFLRSTSEVHILHLSHISIGKDVAVALGNALSKHGELQVGHGPAQFLAALHFFQKSYSVSFQELHMVAAFKGRQIDEVVQCLVGVQGSMNFHQIARLIDWLIGWISNRLVFGRLIDWLIIVCHSVFIGSDFWWSFPFGLSAACHWHFGECLPRYGNSRHGIGSHLPHVLQAGRAQDERPGSESGGRTSPGRSLTGIAAECRLGGSKSHFAKFQGVEKSPRECRRIRLGKGLFCKRIQCGWFFSGQNLNNCAFSRSVTVQLWY